jgi:hypothetical protein
MSKPNKVKQKVANNGTSSLLVAPSRCNDCHHTDWQPCFELSKEQREEGKAWMDAHDQAKHISHGEKYRYSGAIGGAYTWHFTPTSIGIGVSLHCSCGAAINLSNYSEW